jgi:uncharacterized repeat protein (TIGR02543 family)
MEDNAFATLKLPAMNSLKKLDLRRNYYGYLDSLTSLDVSEAKNLRTLNASRNRLTKVTLGAVATTLKSINLSHNKLTAIDASGVSTAATIQVQFNNIPTKSAVKLPASFTGTLKFSPQYTQRTATFDANGGKVSPSTKIVYGGDELGALPTPTKKDYAFMGWFTKKVGGFQAFPGTIMLDGNTTYYAHWKLLPAAQVTKWHSVKISGTAKVKKTLTATVTAPKFAGQLNVKYTYKWFRGKKQIKGATKKTYKLAKADKKKIIKVEVKATVTPKAGYRFVGTGAKTQTAKSKKVK